MAKKGDLVNNPPHYNRSGIECLDAIAAATNEGYEYYLQGNILKYLPAIATIHTRSFNRISWNSQKTS